MTNMFIAGGSSGLGLRLTIDGLLADNNVWATFQSHPQALHYLQSKFKRLTPLEMSLNTPTPDETWPEEIDTAVLCAGAIRNQLMLKETSADFAEHLETNLTGNMHLCQALYPRLRKGTNPHLVIISSRSAYEGNIGQAAYSASRAGLVGLAKTLAREWARKDIKVNVVFPGFLRTRQTLALPPTIREDYEKRNTLGRVNTLAEVSRFIQFLTSTRNISGQLFNLDSRVNTD